MPHTLTPAQEHVQRILAEQSQPQTTESTNGTLLMQLVGDKRELGALQSIEARIARKREFLPKYAGFIEGVLSNSTGLSEDDTTLLQELYVWLVDTFDLQRTSQLYDWMQTHNVALPARMNRNLAAFAAEELSERIKAKLSAGQAIDEDTLTMLEQLTERLDAQDMHDVVRAKWYKQMGLLLASHQQYTRAHAHLSRANQLDDNCGVKTELKRLDKLIAEQGNSTPPQ